jgi:hypothetical protein
MGQYNHSAQAQLYGLSEGAARCAMPVKIVQTGAVLAKERKA